MPLASKLIQLIKKKAAIREWSNGTISADVIILIIIMKD